MSVSIDEVMAQINEVRTKSGETAVGGTSDEIKAIPANQLPPYVSEMEHDIYEKMLANLEQLHGLEASPETIDAIRFNARAKTGNV